MHVQLMSYNAMLRAENHQHKSPLPSPLPLNLLLLQPTQNFGGVDLQDEPAVPLVGVGAEDGEDGALLPGLSQQLVNIHLPVRELEVGPRLAFIGAKPDGDVAIIELINNDFETVHELPYTVSVLFL